MADRIQPRTLPARAVSRSSYRRAILDRILPFSPAIPHIAPAKTRRAPAAVLPGAFARRVPVSAQLLPIGAIVAAAFWTISSNRRAILDERSGQMRSIWFAA